jgi:hypothetical protein
VYLAHAFLAFLAVGAVREINNLRYSGVLDIPTPPASTNYNCLGINGLRDSLSIQRPQPSALTTELDQALGVGVVFGCQRH